MGKTIPVLRPFPLSGRSDKYRPKADRSGPNKRRVLFPACQIPDQPNRKQNAWSGFAAKQAILSLPTAWRAHQFVVRQSQRDVGSSLVYAVFFQYAMCSWIADFQVWTHGNLLYFEQATLKTFD